MLHAIRSRHSFWKQIALKFDDYCFALAIWVDNLYAFGVNAQNAVRILEDLEAVLAREWRLKFKPSSLAHMCCRGNRSAPADVARWPRVDIMNILGHLVSDDGSITHDVSQTIRAMWRSFWKNPGSKRADKFDVPARISMLNRTVQPSFEWKCSRWPMQKTAAVALDSAQCQMIRIIWRVPRREGESIHEHNVRSKTIARNVSIYHGRWSLVWAQRCMSWEQHLNRAATRARHLWCADLLRWHDSAWLRQRRALFAISDSAFPRYRGLDGGNTGTRRLAVRPQKRYEDGLQLCHRIHDCVDADLLGANSISTHTLFDRVARL